MMAQNGLPVDAFGKQPLFYVKGEPLEPMFYVKGCTVFQRPVHKANGNVSMGFAVCDVRDGVDPQDVCDTLNRGEPPENSAKL